MIIKRKSIISGVERERELDITEFQLARWKAGALIQDVCPHLSKEDREFIISGSTQEEWDQVFKEDEDE